MTDTPQLSGRDLARQALAAYKATAHTKPTSAPTRAKTRRTGRPGSGRDPITFAQAIAGLGADIPLQAGLAGGSVIDQWPTLCPQYAGLVQPVHYDDTTGRLDLRPGSHSYAAQLRLLGGQLAKQINDKLGRTVVRSIRVLSVGAITASSEPAAAAEQASEPPVPVHTRDTASPGYHRAYEAHQAARDDLETSPHVAEALARQDRVLNDPANREPQTAFGDVVAQLERLAGPAQLSRSETVHRAALARKRQGDTPAPRRAFDTT